MFDKIRRNIYMSLMLTVILLILVLEAVSCVLVSNTLYKTYLSTASQKLDRSISGCKNYVKSVLMSAVNLTFDNDVITELNSGTGKPITATLDNACNYALKISGITVYSLNSGRIYTSSTLAQPPTLSELKSNNALNDFFLYDNEEFVSLRNNNIAKFYSNSPYDPEYGIVSCCAKVFFEGKVIGYVFADIFPSTLYSYFDFSTEPDFEGGKPFISFKDGFFDFNDNDLLLNDFYRTVSSEYKSSDGKYLILKNSRNFFGGSVQLAIPLRSVTLSITKTLLLIILTGFAAIIIIHFITLKSAKNVNNRLEKLLNKMENDARSVFGAD